MSEPIPGTAPEPEDRSEQKFDPALVERLRKQIESDKDARRDIEGKSALSRELWDTIQSAGSVSKMVTDMGGLDELERNYGKKSRDELEQMIFEESQVNLEKE